MLSFHGCEDEDSVIRERDSDVLYFGIKAPISRANIQIALNVTPCSFANTRSIYLLTSWCHAPEDSNLHPQGIFLP
jgi:hypothetical protein